MSRRTVQVSRLTILPSRPSFRKVLISSIILIPEIDKITAALESVNNSEEITPLFEFNVNSHQSIFRYEWCFLDLNQILRQRSQSLARNSPPTSPQTPAEAVSPPETETTPPQKLGDPSFQSPTSTISNRSAKADHYTDTFANNFLRATLLSLEKHLNKMAWYDDRMRLLPVYVLPLLPLTLKVQASHEAKTRKSSRKTPKRRRPFILSKPYILV